MVGCHGCRKITTDIFIKRSNDAHNNTYDYSRTKYINNSTKVIITCKKHGDFKQVAISK